MKSVKYIECFLLINNSLIKVDDLVWDHVIDDLNNDYYLDTISSPDPETLEYTDWFMRKEIEDLPYFFGRVLFNK